MKKILFIFFLPGWIFLFSSSAHTVDFHAKVIHITDGDAIALLNAANEHIKIRLNDIFLSGYSYGKGD